MKTAAEFHGITKSYHLNDVKVPVLHDISFSIAMEDMVAFAGPSGSGKTTILNLLGCIDKADKGKVIIENEDVTGFSDDRLAELRNDKLGFIFQSFNLIPVLTAYENVEFALQIDRSISREERKFRVMNILKKVGIEQLHNRMPGHMSGGQQQRVAIARALVKNPLIVLADEPTANLDSKSAAETLELMRKMNEEFKTTFVFSTHDTKIMDFARRLIHIRDGAITGDERK